MKKIMILGAGAGQLPFINICKQKGAYVVAISPKGDYPGIKAADKFYDCDTRDKERILEIARKEHIDAITTDQTDVSVPAVAYVAEQMGLKGIGYERAIQFTDKYEMRRAAKHIGVNVPEFALAESLSEARKCIKNMEFPIIIKPTNSSGSRGVYRIDTPGDLDVYFEKSIGFSSTKSVIVEEFIEGREYLADGFAMNGKYINLDLGIKEYFDKKGMYISKMCMFSSAAMVEDRVEKQVLDANKKLVEGLGLEFGITHGEYIYSEKQDKVYLVEIAARGGGVYLSSDLTPRASGINTNEMLLNYLLRDEVADIDKLKLDKRVSAWRCFALKEGIIKQIRNAAEVKEIPGVDKVCLDSLKEGAHVKELSDDTTKYGPILVSGSSRRECFETLNRVENTLEIITENKDGVWSIIW